MVEHPNARLVRRAMDAFAHGDLAQFCLLFDPRVAWHVPGDGPLAGTYRGIDAVLALFGRAFGLSSGSFHVEPIDVMASDGHAVLWQRVTAERDGRRLDVTEAIVFRIVDRRVVEVWERTDQHAMDDFFSVGETTRRRLAAGPTEPPSGERAGAESASFEIPDPTAGRRMVT